MNYLQHLPPKAKHHKHEGSWQVGIPVSSHSVSNSKNTSVAGSPELPAATPVMMLSRDASQSQLQN